MKVFYQKHAVHAVLQSDGNVTLLRAQGAPMAEHGSASAHLQGHVFGCDQQGSPMTVMSAKESCTGSYTPYGLETTLQSVTGFTGQLKAWNLPGYFLGNGYRFFNTVLMRFNSPDSLSPFAAGGINAYMYCAGDPVNRSDPSGRIGLPGRSVSPQINRRYMGSTFNLMEVVPASFDPRPYSANANAVDPFASQNPSRHTFESPLPASSSGVQVGGRTSPGKASLVKRPKMPSGNFNEAISKNRELAKSMPEATFNQWNSSDENTYGLLDLDQSRRARKVTFYAIRTGQPVAAAINGEVGGVDYTTVEGIRRSVTKMLSRTAKDIRK